MNNFIGVDGGGTKTTLAVIDEQLNILHQQELLASNIMSSELDKVLNKLDKAIDPLLKKYKIQGMGMGMAGVDTEREKKKIHSQISRRFHQLRIEIANDGLASLLGALNQQSGILINAGTGSIAIGIDSKDNVCRAGGWDYLLGDEGSGYWIGKKFIQTAIYSFDRGINNRAVKKVEDFFDVTSLEYILGRIYDHPFDKHTIASLAEDVARMAREGNETARKIFANAGYELAGLINAVYRKGEFEHPVKITYSGSIFNSFSLFREEMFTTLEEMGIEFKWMDPVYPPVVGAAMLVINNYGQKGCKAT